MEWLRMPQAVVAAHLEMMPRIQADERHSAAITMAVARSFKRGRWANRMLARWKREMRGRIETVRGPSRQQLAAIGVAFQVVGKGRRPARGTPPLPPQVVNDAR